MEIDDGEVKEIMTKSMDISDGSAELFEKCRTILNAVNGEHTGNSECLNVICTRFLQKAGVDWKDR
jgi:hypothetical protein